MVSLAMFAGMAFSMIHQLRSVSVASLAVHNAQVRQFVNHVFMGFRKLMNSVFLTRYAPGGQL